MDQNASVLEDIVQRGPGFEAPEEDMGDTAADSHTGRSLLALRMGSLSSDLS